MTKALKHILDKVEGTNRLFTDARGEFVNKSVNALLQDFHIKWYTKYSKEIKASIAERHIITLKERIC